MPNDMDCQLKGRNDIYIQILHHDMPCIKDFVSVYVYWIRMLQIMHTNNVWNWNFLSKPENHTNIQLTYLFTY